MGSIAAVVTSLANLPLEAPTDTLFNSATVTVASLLAGLIAGLLWRALAASPRRAILFAATLAITFIIVAVAAIVADSEIERAKSYIVPLAAITFGLLCVLVPFASRRLPTTPSWLPLVLLLFAGLVGGGLASQGDAESGALTLPPRSATIEFIS